MAVRTNLASKILLKNQMPRQNQAGKTSYVAARKRNLSKLQVQQLRNRSLPNL